ncbi:MAG: glycosyl transferase family 1 [Elusimicrobia bacterium RIFOXYB2_FULL_49_7]|nr:MAG: glycosyl transferase family 1 [Elusimicrobia bacterium RIFOXYB2_FULL_49_7]
MTIPRKRIEDIQHIGFISTRLSGNDGVSLEAEKWANVLEDLGYFCYYFAGELDHPPERSFLSPKAHFQYQEIREINEFVFRNTIRTTEISDKIESLKKELLHDIHDFVTRFHIDLLIVENAFAIPMNIPLGLALTEFVAVTGIPTVAHNHDFYWERKRFSVNCVWDYLNTAFPPRHPFIRQVVINSEARMQVALRRGGAAIIIPNIMDFENPLPLRDDYTADVRHSLGIGEKEFFILQPTRVVQRKGIEHSIELVRRLKERGVEAVLVISHASGDEGSGYELRLREFSGLLDVKVHFVSDIIGTKRGRTEDGRKIYSLFDVYPYADLVTYPSNYEGFGNAFLEAIYFKKPVMINNYSIYTHDIKPKGFKVIEIDDYIRDDNVDSIIGLMKNPDTRDEMVEYNYELGRRFYSYSNLRRQLKFIISDFFGEN